MILTDCVCPVCGIQHKVDLPVGLNPSTILCLSCDRERLDTESRYGSPEPVK